MPVAVPMRLAESMCWRSTAEKASQDVGRSLEDGFSTAGLRARALERCLVSRLSSRSTRRPGSGTVLFARVVQESSSTEDRR